MDLDIHLRAMLPGYLEAFIGARPAFQNRQGGFSFYGWVKIDSVRIPTLEIKDECKTAAQDGQHYSGLTHLGEAN